MYLAGAGVGHIAIADFDTVDYSNLHRQVFFSEHECGQSKVNLLKAKMEALNSEVNISAISSIVTEKMLSSLDSEKHPYDVIVDAADNPDTTYMIDKYCSRMRKPFVSAGVKGWESQIFMYVPGSLSYSDIFPRPESRAGVLPCSIAGIAGPVAAFAASIMTAEILKFLLNLAPSNSRLISSNLLTGDMSTLC